MREQRFVVLRLQRLLNLNKHTIKRHILAMSSSGAFIPYKLMKKKLFLEYFSSFW